jgi:hypothetical protein
MATHAFIDANGAQVEIEKALGIRYWSKDKAADSDPHFDHYIGAGDAGNPGTMLAVFGAKTLATNTVSSFYEGLPKGAPKGTQRARKADAPVDDLAGLAERFAAIVAGDWGASSGGGGGVGYNLEDLLQALDDVMAEAGTQINRDKVAAALRDGGGTYKGKVIAEAKEYRKAIAGVEGVKARYETIRTARQPVVTADEVADDFA